MQEMVCLTAFVQGLFSFFFLKLRRMLCGELPGCVLLRTGRDLMVKGAGFKLMTWHFASDPVCLAAAGGERVSPSSARVFAPSCKSSARGFVSRLPHLAVSLTAACLYII